MSQLGGWHPYQWQGAPPVYGGSVFALARRYASYGWSEEQIRQHMLTLHAGGQYPGVRTQEIGRAATYGYEWHGRIQALGLLDPDQVLNRGQHLLREGLPENYRYTVDYLVDSGAGEWRTVVVESDRRLSTNEIQQAGLTVYGQVSQRYRDFAVYTADDTTQFRITGAWRNS